MNKANWTKGQFFPEQNKPTYNEGANAYQRAIIVISKEGRIIPGFSFGETPEECSSNGWLMASSKELLKAVQLFLKKDPTAKAFANEAMYKAMGHLETQ